MNVLKKSMAILTAAVLLLAMAVPVMADNTVTGTITITNAEAGRTYSAYKLLDLSYDNHNTEITTDDGYVYYLPGESSPWYAFLKGNTVKDTYLTIGNSNIVTWKEGADAEAFAELALKYAAENSIVADAEESADGTTVTLDVKGFGYYLVDSGVGSLIFLTTATPILLLPKRTLPPLWKRKFLKLQKKMKV